MKNCIYAIAKNESANVGVFMAAAHEAGLPVYVLDTGSTDDTVERLKQAGAHVFISTPLEPFAFDVARNMALSCVPESLDGFCVAVDLDERVTPALGQVLKNNQFRGYTNIAYGYKPEADRQPDWVVLNNRVHRRNMYQWYWPVHEGLVASKPERVWQTNEVFVSHHPKDGRCRTYTEMLAQAVKDTPKDERMNLLYARDLFNDARIEHAETQFRVFVDLKSTDLLSCSYARCMLAKCCRRMKDFAGELEHLYAAVKIMPRREAWVYLAEACYRGCRYGEVVAHVEKALAINEGQFWPHAEPSAWDHKPHELAMLAAYQYFQDVTVAIKHGEKALAFAKQPHDRTRIMKNLAQLKS